MKKLVVALVFAATFLAGSKVVAQAPDKLLALYIYNFACNATWPSFDGAFTIAVMGQPEIAAELVTITRNRTMDSHPIRVVAMSRADEIQGCQVVYIPSRMSEQFPSVNTKIGTQPVLIISDEPGLAKAGSALNFVTIGGKLRYEVNVNALASRGLTLAPEIVKLGIGVESNGLLPVTLGAGASASAY